MLGRIMLCMGFVFANDKELVVVGLVTLNQEGIQNNFTFFVINMLWFNWLNVLSNRGAIAELIVFDCDSDDRNWKKRLGAEERPLCKWPIALTQSVIHLHCPLL